MKQNKNTRVGRKNMKKKDGREQIKQDGQKLRNSLKTGWRIAWLVLNLDDFFDD